jgi:hypothetical protein
MRIMMRGGREGWSGGEGGGEERERATATKQSRDRVGVVAHFGLLMYAMQQLNTAGISSSYNSLLLIFPQSPPRPNCSVHSDHTP